MHLVDVADQKARKDKLTNATAEASSAAAAAVQIPVNSTDRSGSAAVNENAPGLLAIHNPLVSRTLPYVRDTCGRPRKYVSIAVSSLV